MISSIFHAAIQIFYVQERQHWITTALIRGEIYLFDSCFNGTIEPSVELQIAQLYRPLVDSNSLLLTVVPMQQQEFGSNNCGLFSIAAAYHTAKGNDVKSISFNEKRMRSHLIKCLELEKLSAFPKIKAANVKRAEFQHIAIIIYCPCKRPDSFEDMIQCNQCNTWYHKSCAKVTKDPLGDWFCIDCI